MIFDIEIQNKKTQNFLNEIGGNEYKIVILRWWGIFNIEMENKILLL